MLWVMPTLSLIHILMPYKLNKDRKRAAMFYAGLVMVANDVADFSEHKKETLC